MSDIGVIEPVIIVHGGAWAIPNNLAELSREGVKEAAVKGYQMLLNGKSAIDAVEAAVSVLEDNPVFDAGKGSCLNASGDVEMDAIIMEGKHLNAGAVAAVQNIRNPIQLARLVLEQSDHVLVVGQGANEFASEHGIGTVEKSYLVMENALEEWEKYKKFKTTVDTFFNNRIDPLSGHDTVGAVALDVTGLIACATSTGGITGKRVGRVGDSPIIGCGAYCVNEVGGVSCTGHGESIMKLCLAKHVIMLIENGDTPKAALHKGLQAMIDKVKGAGGVICVTKSGEIAYHFTTERMAWAAVKNSNLTWGLDRDELNEQMITPSSSSN